jgi:hypothetical protein
MRSEAIKPGERAALIYLSGVILLEVSSIEGIAYAGGGFAVMRALWLSPYMLVINLLAFGAGIWFGWMDDSVPSDIKLVFRILAPFEIFLFAVICLLRP